MKNILPIFALAITLFSCAESQSNSSISSNSSGVNTQHIRTGIENPFVHDNNIERFYELTNNTIEDVENILPLWIIEEYDINVFEKKDNANLYLMYNNQIYNLYPFDSPGSEGVKHICAEDINQDGFMELYLSFNFGKNMIMNQIVGFDTKSETLLESHTTYNKTNYFKYENGILMANESFTIEKRTESYNFLQMHYEISNEVFEATIDIDLNNINFPAVFFETEFISHGLIKFNVSSKYVGETYSYMGSSSLFGATPSIKTNDKTYYPEIGCNDDFVKIIIEKNKQFDDSYSIGFENYIGAGIHDLIVSYKDKNCVLENVFVVEEI